MKPNARAEPRPMAAATQERRLLGVGSTAMFGVGMIETAAPLLLSIIDLRSPWHTFAGSAHPLPVAPIKRIQLRVGVRMLKHQRWAGLHPQRDPITHLRLGVFKAVG